MKIEEWIDRYTVLDHRRLDAIEYFTEHFSRLDNLIATPTTFKKTLLWFFALDDLFDGGQASDVQLRKIAFGFRNEFLLDTIGDTTTMIRAKELVYLWAEILEESHVTTQGCNVANYCLDRMLMGMLEENETEFKALQSYLEVGKHTSGIPLIFTLQFYAYNIFEQAESVMYSLERAGEIVRIYNDIRSYGKEVLEGKTNSVGILDKTMPHALSVDFLYKLAEKKTNQLKYIIENPRLSSLIGVVRTLKDFYQAGDFHDCHEKGGQ
jgi:hypothetical protein